MSKPKEPRLAKWPFFLGNIILLGLAYFLYARRGAANLGHLEIAAFMAYGLLGSLLAVAPYILEYRAAVKMVETGTLVSTVAGIRNLELLAAQINAATARWQLVQEHSANSIAAARDITDKMAAETASFTEFLQKANDSERDNLKLELEKFRRMETEWLTIITRLLDHAYALYKAGERSGQPGLIEQLDRFQNSCRDVTRRIGLIAFVPAFNETFDPQWHHAKDDAAEVPAGTKIRDTIATGYTYQGRLIRPALVDLHAPEGQLPEPAPEPAASDTPATDSPGEPVGERTLL